jgi:hypothetical protein
VEQFLKASNGQAELTFVAFTTFAFQIACECCKYWTQKHHDDARRKRHNGMPQTHHNARQSAATRNTKVRPTEVRDSEKAPITAATNLSSAELSAVRRLSKAPHLTHSTHTTKEIIEVLPLDSPAPKEALPTTDSMSHTYKSGPAFSNSAGSLTFEIPKSTSQRDMFYQSIEFHKTKQKQAHKRTVALDTVLPDRPHRGTVNRLYCQ